MRRIVAAGAVLGAILLPIGNTAAWADAPLHEKSSFSGSETIPAGEFCDFTYSISFTVYENTVVFGDPDDPDKVIIQSEAHVTHTNVDTGYTLTEIDYSSIQIDASDAEYRSLGIIWHLRDADGKLVVVSAGQFVVNTETGEIVKVTPNINPDFAAVICPALGGEPAG